MEPKATSCMKNRTWNSSKEKQQQFWDYNKPLTDMCKNRERDTSKEQEKDRIASYTRTMSKKKKTIMEMALPYTTG
jgi:hypothetical protein